MYSHSIHIINTWELFYRKFSATQLCFSSENKYTLLCIATLLKHILAIHHKICGSSSKGIICLALNPLSSKSFIRLFTSENSAVFKPYSSNTEVTRKQDPTFLTFPQVLSYKCDKMHLFPAAFSCNIFFLCLTNLSLEEPSDISTRFKTFEVNL